MRVLGIDPGFDRLGVAVLEKNKGDMKEHVLFSDCLTTHKTEAHEQRLTALGLGIRDIIEKWQPDYVALEKLFFNKNITNAMRVAEARGVVVYESYQAGAHICEYGPQEIKVAVTGYGKSDKTHVTTMVKRITGISKAHILDDEYDAIAVAITCIAHEYHTAKKTIHKAP